MKDSDLQDSENKWSEPDNFPSLLTWEGSQVA